MIAPGLSSFGPMQVRGTGASPVRPSQVLCTISVSTDAYVRQRTELPSDGMKHSSGRRHVCPWVVMRYRPLGAQVGWLRRVDGSDHASDHHCGNS